MLKLGQYNTLEVLRSTSVGMYLGAEDVDDVLLPNKYVHDTLEVGDEIEVFIYLDTGDRVVATNLTPKIQLDSFACLEVVVQNKMGIFFDMGLEKDLLVPYREQNPYENVSIGDKRIVFMYLDEVSDRLTGSLKWKGFCYNDPAFEINEKVNIMIGEKTDLGRNVLVNNQFYGLIYANEIFEELEVGDQREAYIKQVRDDGHIDVSLQKLGYEHVLTSSEKLLELIKANDGTLDIGDKSSPEKIYSITGMSKKTFKKAIGDLYKKKLILLEREQIKLK